METRATSWLGCTALWPPGFWSVPTSHGSSPRPQRRAHLDGGWEQRAEAPVGGQGLTGLLFTFLLWLPRPARTQSSVWKGPPRTGQVSTWWPATSLVPSWAPGTWSPGV